MTPIIKITSALTCIIAVSGCAGQPDTLIVDGPKTAAYQQDLKSCRQLSAQKKATHEGRNIGAVVGGLVGAAEADGGDALEGAIVGAAIGGLVGSVDETIEVDSERDKIVFNCMRGRGHNVVG